MTTSDNNYKPKISVILAIYNAAPFISQCLSSITQQTLKEIEIICVDDCSTDDSVSVINSFIENDTRIKLLSTTLNSGAGAARNIGMLSAQGEYLSFLDADDFFDLSMLDKAYSKAKSLDLDVIMFKAIGVDHNTGDNIPIPWSIRSDILPSTDVFSASDIKKDFFHSAIWWAWDKLFKKTHIEKFELSFQEQRTTNDLYFVASATITANRIAYIDEVLAFQRQNISTSLSNTRHLSYNCCINALSKLQLFLKRNNIYEIYKNDFQNYLVSFCLWNINTIKGPSFFLLYPMVQELFISTGAIEEFYYPHLLQNYEIARDQSPACYLQKLNEQVEHSAKIVSHEYHLLNKTLSERDSEILALRDIMTSQANKLKELEESLSSKDSTIAVLNTHVEMKDNELKNIYCSKSWRMATRLSKIKNFIFRQLHIFTISNKH